MFGWGKKEEVAKEAANHAPQSDLSSAPSLDNTADNIPAKRRRGRPKVAKEPMTEDRQVALREKYSGKNEISFRLNQEQQQILVNMVATYVPTSDICQFFQQEYGYDLTPQAIHKYKISHLWKPKIEEARKRFESDLADEELASKRRRIQEYSRIYELCNENENHTKAADMLSKIREEIEGKSSNSTVIAQYNQYNSMNDEDLRRFIEENNRFLQIAEKRKAAITVNPEEVTSGEGS